MYAIGKYTLWVRLFLKYNIVQYYIIVLVLPIILVVLQLILN
jgi:hypothetical protein